MELKIGKTTQSTVTSNDCVVLPVFNSILSFTILTYDTNGLWLPKRTVE
jgi:hypothetical protein